MTRARAAAALIALAGCKGNVTGSGAPAAATAPAAPSASQLAVPNAEKPSLTRWSGTYASVPGSIYVVDGGEWAGVRWRGDDASAGVGEGTLTIAIESATAHVSGSAEGAIGDALLVGAVEGTEVTARVLRKDATDRGFTGTLLATQSADKLTGTMRLALADARVIREASFSLSRKAP